MSGVQIGVVNNHNTMQQRLNSSSSSAALSTIRCAVLWHDVWVSILATLMLIRACAACVRTSCRGVISVTAFAPHKENEKHDDVFCNHQVAEGAQHDEDQTQLVRISMHTP